MLKKGVEKLKVKSGQLLFDLVTDIPESVLSPTQNPEKRCKILIRRASFKAAAVSATLSIPAGFAGVITALPDIATIWKIQSQLVSDIAATYGKFALLNSEALVWCLFRHSATQLLRDVAIRSGSRIITQKISSNVLQNLLQRIGLQVSSKFLSRAFARAVPFIGSGISGAYAYYDTREVGKTAVTYFRALNDNQNIISDPSALTSEVFNEEETEE